MITKKWLPLDNYNHTKIEVEFLIIHYSALSAKATIKLFSAKDGKVSAHFLIDVDGTIYELVPSFSGQACKAWHAGRSSWCEKGKNWTNFNDFSLGIELVNYNGNIFDYTNEQYKSLASLVNKLKILYPKLSDPARILGHEQIAGFRGKIDPGIRFSWTKFFKLAFANNKKYPLRKAVLSQIYDILITKKSSSHNDKLNQLDEFWANINSFLEGKVKNTSN
ncbi:MAG: N-acetylmuramoyl-L-alanine amidase [SAR324 cluster bacterium]|nr:N-acetylmuramoyl-L-alanine amidase [SAR324 cluster bacterium]